MFFCLILDRIFPKFPSLTSHGNFPEIYQKLSAPLQPYTPPRLILFKNKALRTSTQPFKNQPLYLSTPLHAIQCVAVQLYILCTAGRSQFSHRTMMLKQEINSTVILVVWSNTTFTLYCRPFSTETPKLQHEKMNSHLMSVLLLFPYSQQQANQAQRNENRRKQLAWFCFSSQSYHLVHSHCSHQHSSQLFSAQEFLNPNLHLNQLTTTRRHADKVS